MRKDWPILTNMPDGWRVDKTAGSPLAGHVFITNGKSVLNGQKRALLAVEVVAPVFASAKSPESKPETTKQIIDAQYLRTVNDLARAKFKERMLNDILCDLMICEINGWDKREYVHQIQAMIGDLAA